MKLEVLYEDNHLLIVNKPNNILVQKDTTGDIALEDIAKQYIKEKYNKPGEVFLGVVHRIDRPVSGIVVFARTSKALTRINEQFKLKEVTKKYLAIVKQIPQPEKATLVHFIYRDTKTNKSKAYNKPFKDAKESSLTYSVLRKSDNYTLLEIDLHTGRHHQIRCQLATIGSPIKGDLKYGFPRSNENGGISLHAHSIEFNHPVTKEKIKITAPPPNEKLWNVFLNK